MQKRGLRWIGVLVAAGGAALTFTGAAAAADQTQIGAGNARAEQIGVASPLVQSAKRLLIENAKAIKDSKLREATLDAFNNPQTCIAHRIGVTEAVKSTIIQRLEQAELLNASDVAPTPGGIEAGIFPPVRDENTACPHLPQAFDSAPGSEFGGHHSYPGGLAVHESFNGQSAINLANTYRGEYAQSGPLAQRPRSQPEAGFISQDLILAAPIWHDWAKMLVFQWNTDGTEF